MKQCKCCHSEIYLSPFFTLNNMPDSAQGFLEKDDLSNDKGSDIEVYQCPYCGLVQLFCEPVPYYKDVIRATGLSEEMKAFRNNQFAGLADKYQLKHKKIIEYGAFTGDVLDVVRNSFPCVAYGLEHSPNSVKTGLDKGLNMIQGYLDSEDIVLQEGPFDLFYCLNFMEHMVNPEGFLKGAAANLSEEGIGVIEVPNCDMIFTEKLYSEFISDHLMYFTKETLIQMLNRNGFEVLECDVIWYDYIISAVVRKKKLIDGNGFSIQYEKMREIIHEFLQEHITEGKIAVWGAGHQSIANLSILNMKEYISCVIDSAPFKQKKYTPASHLLIMSPDVLENNEIKTVLIMAGGYSDEVASIILEKYKNVRAYILRQDFVEEIRA